MFCPKCGRDDSHQFKYCPGCGTNLEVVNTALTTGEDTAFSKVNKLLDRTVARYADQYFETAALAGREGRVGNSWRLARKGVLTFLIDLALLPLMFFFPLRLVLLLFYTPVGLLQERSERKQRNLPAIEATSEPAKLELPETGRWRTGPIGSVTEHTTVHLELEEPSPRRANTSGDLGNKPPLAAT
jgi:hypothetical protein